jgi:hypothetical protein
VSVYVLRDPSLLAGLFMALVVVCAVTSVLKYLEWKEANKPPRESHS